MSGGCWPSSVRATAGRRSSWRIGWGSCRRRSRSLTLIRIEAMRYFRGADGEPPVIADPGFWQQLLGWLRDAGVSLLVVAGFVVGGILTAWVLKFVIRR